MTNLANVKITSELLYVNTYSNTTNSLFSVVIPSENIAVSLNTTNNIQSYSISSLMIPNSNINVAAVNIGITQNNISNTYTHTITPVAGGPSFNITVPFVITSQPGTNSALGFANFAAQPSIINLVSGAAQWSNNAMWVSGATAGVHQAGAGWYKTQLNIQTFSTQFTFQPAANTTPMPSGLTFCIQNSNIITDPSGGAPIFGDSFGIFASGDANLVGYGGYNNNQIIGNSVAVKFDQNPNNQGPGGYSTYPPGSFPNQTGLYTNSGSAGVLSAACDLNPYGINFYTGHIFSCNIVYDGVYLTMVLLDTTTNVQARFVWAINIPYWITSNYAWVGFTGGELPSLPVQIHSWSFQEGFNQRLDTPILSLANGQYASAQTVTITADVGANVYYTTNGLLPTTGSTLYTGPISISSNTILQAVTVQNNFTDSYIALGNYQINSANVINFGNGFTANDGHIVCGTAYANGTSIQLMDQVGNTSAAALWYAAPVNIQTAFTTNFQITINSNNTGSGYGLGIVFVIQNQPTNSLQIPSQRGAVTGGPFALGYYYQSLGYGNPTGLSGTSGFTNTGGILNSIGIKIDAFNNSTQLYTNGAVPTSPDFSMSPVILTNTSGQTAAGHPMNVQISYDGISNVTMSIHDTVSNTNFSKIYTGINIPAIVGSNTAYVGFTASCGFFFAAMKVNSWTMT